MSKDKELISLKMAVQFINELHQWNPTKEGRDIYSLQHLYNCINKKKIKRYGPRHAAQVDKEEIEMFFGPKRAC